MVDTAVVLATESLNHTSQLLYNRTRNMLPALGKPMLVRVMDRLYRGGIRKFIVILGERDGVVASYLNNRWLPNVTIEFIIKLNPHPLGRILSGIATSHDHPFLIASYNSFTHANFTDRMLKYHHLTPKDLILTGAMNSLSKSGVHTYAQVGLQTEVGYATEPDRAAEPVLSIGTAEDPQYQNLILTNFACAGQDFVAYLKGLPNKLPKANTLNEIFSDYIQEHTVRLVRSSWILQVETDQDIITLNRSLLDEKLDAHILSELPYTVRIKEPVRIDPGVSIGQGAVIGPHVYLESGCSVGHNASLQNCIIMSHANVPAQTALNGVIVSTRGMIAE